MFFTHHRLDRLAQSFLAINQDKVFPALNIFMKLTQFLVLDSYTIHATHPGTQQGGAEALTSAQGPPAEGAPQGPPGIPSNVLLGG